MLGAMTEQPVTNKRSLFAGIICLALGLLFTLVGADLVPVPGGPKSLRAPLGAMVFVGLGLLLGGGVAVLQGIGRIGPKGEVPAGTPYWIRVTYYLVGIATFACFGISLSWAAFVPAPREYSGSFLGGDTARIALGIGAIVIWICTIAGGISGARKLLRRTGP